ncbi:hypothetical protein TNCV_1636191 [Trichonephila clavipes]|uniref:Uncharacterized protein n=1 Tax=Trichonephila clavipes TaxID=2585209 RepID=A0A8X6V4I1_TRICX|nr:hypothetical protein TNCV_1636191 [Trichonephila clavipes]
MLSNAHGVAQKFCPKTRVTTSKSLRTPALEQYRRYNYLVVKVTDSWLSSHEFEPSTAKNLPCRGRRFTLNLPIKGSPVGVMGQLGEGVTVQVSFYSLDHGSKL